MRKPLMPVFLFFTLGIVFYNNISFYIICAVLTALFLILVLKKKKYLVLYCFIFFVFGIASTMMWDNILQKRYDTVKSLNEFVGYVVSVDENLCTIKNFKENYCLIATFDKPTNLKPGDYIVFSGQVKPRPEYKKIIMYSRGVDAYISCKNNSIKVVDKKSFLTYPYMVRSKLGKALTAIDPRGGAFISGLITGYTNDISEDDTNYFSELGISHILAVSGFNIGIIYFSLNIILGRFSARTRYIVTLIICFLYTAIGAFEPSITRAFIMIAAATGAKLLNRYYDVLNGIVLTAFVMLIINVYSLYNIGFQLSFLATAGIILLKDDIKDRIPYESPRFKDEISVALAALISVFPILIWYKGVLSIFYLLINIILSPMIAFTTITGFVASILFLIFKFKVILYPIVFLGLIVVRVIEGLARYNYLMYFGKPTLAFLIFYYLLLIIDFKFIKIKNPKTRTYFKTAVIILTVISLVYTSNNLKIHMLNVGQGDSMLIETPSKKLILIDTGPEFKDYSAAKSKVVPYIKRLGYGKIDLLIITHFHNDHAGGIDYILNELKIEKIAAPEENEKIKIPIIKLGKGDTINEGYVSFDVLLPEENLITKGTNNENCLVMELQYKDFSMLLTSDAERKDIDSISIRNYDVLKVSHHGSYASYSQNLINNSDIKTALISVGKNSFGHPSVETISSLVEHSIDIYRTDLNGDIIINTNGKSYELSAH